MNIYKGQVETSIVSYGVSDGLIAEFDMLREVICSEGRHKYAAKTVDLLAQHIVCRHYGNLCYEFSHLNWAIILANTNSASGNTIQTGLLNYYWIEQCQWPQHFNKYFSNLCTPANGSGQQAISVNINSDLNQLKDASKKDKALGLSLRIYDHSFNISASRANILACFMEWLICIVPDLLAKMEASLHGKGHNAIRDFSSFLQKQIYDYLSEHLPPAKLQQRFRLIHNWYNGDSAKLINDDGVLRFWQQHSSLEGYGKYSSVVKDTLSYLTALDTVNTSLGVKHADNRDDSLEEAILRDSEPKSELYDDQESILHFESASQFCLQISLPITELMESPKALNKQQVEFFELYAQYSQYLLPLSRTWLRLQVFAKVQHQIIQMARVKDSMATSTQHYQHLCEYNYQHVKHQCVRLMANNQQSLFAISQLLSSVIQPSMPSHACLVLVKLMPQLPSCEAHAKDFAALIENAIGEGKVINKQLVAQWQLSYPYINTLIKQSQLALKQINRQGFTPATLLKSDDYLRCGELLFDLNKLIKQLVKQINKHVQDSQENFDADRLIFISEFTTLYSKIPYESDSDQSGDENGE